MTTKTDNREELVKQARDIAEKAKAENRDLTVEEQTTIGEKLTEVKALNDRQVAEAKSRVLLAQLDSLAVTETNDPVDPAGKECASLGEHFVKHAHASMIATKGRSGASASAPEFKAATDNHVIGGWTVGAPLLTDFDRTIVRAHRIRLTVADLLGKGTISGNAVSYLVEAAMEGDYATVAEAGAKPQIHFLNPTQVTDALKKIAGFIKLTDEFLEDADFLVSEINNRLLYQLGFFEEKQLLAGDGAGQNILGLLGRSGIQTETAAAVGDNADAIFRAITKIELNSGLPADGLVINPSDYQTFRLEKDGNKQYLGGGFFQGQYGTSDMPMQPPLWGLRTVVTPAIAAGTVLVGAYSMASTLYRKGGIRVESTNSNASDFTSNLVTVRAEERIALAVRVPLGFCKLTLSAKP
jgi:HK97 family phage major capsid protein